MVKLIRIQDSTYYELANYGKWSDTMDDIITRLLKSGRGKNGEVRNER
jgi:predicted CopG family antitoxin